VDPLRFNVEPHLITDVRRHARIDERLDRTVSDTYGDDQFIAQILDETDAACTNRPSRRRQGKVKIDRPNAENQLASSLTLFEPPMQPV
jgi:hypothetical protein